MQQEAAMPSEDTQSVTRTDFSSVIREDGTIMDVQRFLGLLAQTRLYWIVLTRGLEWGMVVGRIAAEFFGKEREAPDPLRFLHGLPDEYPDYGRFFMPEPPDVCFMRRSKVPAEVLSVRFGVPVSPIAKAKYITLNPLEEWAGKGLPPATVGQELWSMELH